jgi:hypothetical protein
MSDVLVQWTRSPDTGNVLAWVKIDGLLTGGLALTDEQAHELRFRLRTIEDQEGWAELWEDPA